MKKKLSKHGNSLAIVIDKPILEQLSINEKTVFAISTDGDAIVLKSIRTKKTSVSSDAKMQKLYDEIVKEHAPALKKLAKN